MPITLKKIVVGYDGFDRNEGLPALAMSLAKEHGAQLQLVHVAPKRPHRIWKLPSVSGETLHQKLVSQRQEQLEALADKARTKGVDARATVRTGTPHEEIIREVLLTNADLVLISDEPTSARQRGFGAVTSKLLRECPCPVLAKRDHRKFRHKSIVASVDVEPSPSDESPANRQIVELAGAIARPANGKVFVFHSWALWGESMLRSNYGTRSEEVDELLAAEAQDRIKELELLLGKCDLQGVDVAIEARKGLVLELLPEFVTEQMVDLVVMGTVSRTGLKRIIMGNTAERIINQLTCSVLAVKPEGFVSPVTADEDV